MKNIVIVVLLFIILLQGHILHKIISPIGTMQLCKSYIEQNIYYIKIKKISSVKIGIFGVDYNGELERYIPSQCNYIKRINNSHKYVIQGIINNFIYNK